MSNGASARHRYQVGMLAHSKRRNLVCLLAFCALVAAALTEIVHPWVPMWLAVLLLAVTAVAVFTPRRRSEPDERRARHEAAHAVVGALTGMRIAGVSIVRDGASGGRTRAYPNPEDSFPDAAWASLVTLLAGQIADVEHDGGSANDWSRVIELVAVLIACGQQHPGTLTFDSIVGEASEQARTLLTESREPVEAVTTALLRRSRLTGAQFEQIMAGAR